MNPFGRDPFDDFFRRFFGDDEGYSREEIIHGEEEERIIDFIETPKKIYIVFELFGYSAQDISVEVKGRELVVRAKRKPSESDDEYVAEKLSAEKRFDKILPKFVKTKTMAKTFRNGVLELSFDKK